MAPTRPQRTGDPLVEYSIRQVGLYVQDEAKLAKNLTVAAGIRVEGQSHVRGLFNLAPRAHFTYSPNSRTTLRGGLGRFFNWYESDVYEQTLRFDGSRETETLLANPSWPDAGAGLNAATSRSTRILASPDLTLPRTFRTSLGVERNLAGRLRFSVDYSYSQGSRELRSRNRSILGSNRSVREIESTARSTRHVVDTRLNLMPSPTQKAGFFVGYLFEAARNEADGALSLPADENDLRAEWGRSLTDSRHRVFGLLNLNPTKAISIGALLQAQSGTPFDVTTGRRVLRATPEPPRAGSTSTCVLDGPGASAPRDRLDRAKACGWSASAEARACPTPPIPERRSGIASVSTRKRSMCSTALTRWRSARSSARRFLASRSWPIRVEGSSWECPFRSRGA